MGAMPLWLLVSSHVQLATAGLARGGGTVTMASAPPSTDKDLLIVGAGTLGLIAGREWKKAFPASRVVGETRTDARHDALRSAGIEPRVRQESSTASSDRFPNLLLAFSPGRNEDYVGDVARSLAHWDGTGGCAFTSSGGVYAEADGGVVTEDSPTSDSPRSAKLLAAEKHVLDAGATVVRLAGLYTAERGAHNYWLSQERVEQWSGGIINLLHYEDAACGALAAIRARLGPRVLLLCDDRPMTRGEIVDAALRSPVYADVAAGPTFTQESGPKGKVYDNSATRALLGDWALRHPDFERFMASATASAATA